MNNRLPPLTALRAFDAAARHESFSRAADELSVTHAAVSHQIKALEAWLGLALFERRTRAVTLTPSGQEYRAVIEDAFNQIRAGTARVRTGSDGPLHVTTTPAFAVRWLAPRLGQLWNQHPELDLRLHEASWRRELGAAAPRFDLGIRLGAGQWPGLDAILLLRGHLTPTLGAGMLSSGAILERSEDLARHTLLHEFDRRAWQEWFRRHGLNPSEAERGPVFDDINLVYGAALSGHGVGLLHTALTAAEVAAGQLAQPFHETGEETNFFIVYPRGTGALPKVARFRDWLLAQ